MPMRSFLLPLEQHEAVPSVLECAALVAERFNSKVEGIAVRPSLAEYVAVDPIGVAALPDLDRQTQEQADRVRRLFEDFAQKRGMAGSFIWPEYEPVTDSGAASYARVFDLTVLGRPGGVEPAPRMSLLETILFESGRPILIAPPKPPKTLGDTVLIAWNQSTETARCTALAMPFLTKAKRIIVLTVEGATVPGPSGRLLAKRLEVSGLPVEERTVPMGKLNSGGAMLTHAMNFGCDLMIKGAYTQSRLRQMIFGGATSHILANAELPVFMAH